MSVNSIIYGQERTLHLDEFDKCFVSTFESINSADIHKSMSSIPAPYEICPEDYLISMVWKRTPAGELAFNQCPLNATGTVRGPIQPQ